MADTYLKITLVRSPIGYRKYQGITAKALGLRRLNFTVVHKETPSIRGMVNQISHLLQVEEATQDDYTKYAATRSSQWRNKSEAPVAEAAGSPVATTKDDLTKIEGIGKKMSSALVAAGIDTFAKLAAADMGALRKAIEGAGMSLAPSMETWAEQAGYAVKGDWDGLSKLQDELVGGRRVQS